jgi:hypothetical protein
MLCYVMLCYVMLCYVFIYEGIFVVLCVLEFSDFESEVSDLYLICILEIDEIISDYVKIKKPTKLKSNDGHGSNEDE